VCEVEVIRLDLLVLKIPIRGVDMVKMESFPKTFHIFRNNGIPSETPRVKT